MVHSCIGGFDKLNKMNDSAFFSANASQDDLGQRATCATLNASEMEGSSATNLKNQHFMKKVGQTQSHLLKTSFILS